MDMLKQLTGSQKGGDNGSTNTVSENQGDVERDPVDVGDVGDVGGRRRRKSHRGNSWLAHVKATMKLNRGKSFKQILKMAKKSYKKSQSQSQSQSGGRKRKSGKGTRKGQYGGSGGKSAGIGASAAPYV